MKSRIESAGLGQELRIMALNNANIVAQVRRDLKNGMVRAGEQGGESMAHRMGRYPRATLSEHVFSKRTGKIVAVTILAVLIVGAKHKGFSQTVVIANEGQELSSQRDAALLSILKLDRRSFPQVKDTGLKIEPERSRLNDFQRPQPSMEPAKQDKFQIIPLAFVNQPGDQLGRAKVFARGVAGRRDAEMCAGVLTHGLFHVSAPVEETADGHQVPESGRSGSIGQPGFVVFSHPVSSHIARTDSPAPARKGPQNVVFRAYGGPGPSPALPSLSAPPHVINEAVNGVADQTARFQGRGMPVPGGIDNRLAEFARFQGNVMPLFFFLDGQPIDVSAFVDAPRKSLSGVHVRVVTQRLSHFESAKVRQVQAWTINSPESTGLEPATSAVTGREIAKGLSHNHCRTGGPSDPSASDNQSQKEKEDLGEQRAVESRKPNPTE